MKFKELVGFCYDVYCNSLINKKLNLKTSQEDAYVKSIKKWTGIKNSWFHVEVTSWEERTQCNQRWPEMARGGLGGYL